MGLSVLKYSDDLAARRKKQWLHYEQLLNGSDVQILKITPGTTAYNYSYFPVVFRNEETLLRVLQALNLQYVNPRRYFYPSLNRLDYVTNNSCPVSERIAPCVLCLPLFHDLSMEEQDMIVRVLTNALN